MTWQQVLNCGVQHGFDISSGEAFAECWLNRDGFDSVPPLPANGFASLQSACEWIAANFTGQNPCQTR